MATKEVVKEWCPPRELDVEPRKQRWRGHGSMGGMKGRSRWKGALDVKLQNVKGGPRLYTSHLTNIASYRVRSPIWWNKDWDESANVVLFERLPGTEGSVTGTPRYSGKLFGGVAGLILRKRLLCVLRKMEKNKLFLICMSAKCASALALWTERKYIENHPFFVDFPACFLRGSQGHICQHTHLQQHRKYNRYRKKRILASIESIWTFRGGRNQRTNKAFQFFHIYF